MSFATLALIAVIGLVGPALAWRQSWHLPTVIGQLASGILLGATGLNWLRADNSTFTFLADIGFALVMFVAGSHVPVRDQQLLSGLKLGIIRVSLVAAAGTALAIVISDFFNTGHAALYAVLISSSSAALVLPIVDSVGLQGSSVLALIPQVAVADTICIVALPLAIDPKHAVRAGLGALAIIAAGIVLFFGLRSAERSGLRKRLHAVSQRRGFALELRVNLAILFALAALAVATHVSIMLAGFALGLTVAGVGEPRRLARQIFALSEGFLGPLFYIWLGASLNLRELGRHPSFIWLGLVLGLAAVLSHLAARLTGQGAAFSTLAAAQLGLPVAAATLGTQLHLLKSGEAPALMLGALTTIALAAVAASYAVRRQAV